MNDFLPSNYEVPQSSGNYMKLEQGDNKFRVMSSAIIGYEYWDTENKPVRSPKPFAETPGIKTDKNGKKSIKHFWAFAVWNYKQERIQLLELTQTSIMNSIKGYVDDPDWGDPKGYDIVINRKGEKLETEYTVRTSPHSEVPQTAIDTYTGMNVNLDALYNGDDPFEGNQDQSEIKVDEVPY